MRNHACTFAKYCPDYEYNKCQGCRKAMDKDPVGAIKSKVAEELKKQYQSIADRYKSKVMIFDEIPDMRIKKVHFNKPMTIVLWVDGTKTMVKCQGNDLFSKETGLAMAIAKKALGNKGNFNEVFKKWIPEYGKDDT